MDRAFRLLHRRLAVERLLHLVHDGLHKVLGQGIQEPVDGAEVHVEGLTVDIGLARDGGDGDLVYVPLLQKATECLDDGTPAANDAPIGALLLL